MLGSMEHKNLLVKIPNSHFYKQKMRLTLKAIFRFSTCSRTQSLTQKTKKKLQDNEKEKIKFVKDQKKYFNKKWETKIRRN